jgi:hypothetical protein
MVMVGESRSMIWRCMGGFRKRVETGEDVGIQD